MIDYQEHMTPEIISKADTIYIEKLDPGIQQQYFQILESSNSHMGWWITALGVFIAALGVLFTFASILAAIFIIRQSKEFKERQKELFESASQRISGLEKESKILLERLQNDSEQLTEKIKVINNNDPETILKLQEDLTKLKSDISTINQNRVSEKIWKNIMEYNDLEDLNKKYLKYIFPTGNPKPIPKIPPRPSPPKKN